MRVDRSGGIVRVRCDRRPERLVLAEEQDAALGPREPPGMLDDRAEQGRHVAVAGQGDADLDELLELLGAIARAHTTPGLGAVRGEDSEHHIAGDHITKSSRRTVARTDGPNQGGVARSATPERQLVLPPAWPFRWE